METSNLYDIEIEQKVLGAVLADPISLSLISDDWDEAVFYNPKHKTVAWAIRSLYMAGKQIDRLTVIGFLKSNNKLEEVGGAYGIAQFDAHFAGTYRTPEHYKILQQFYLLRKIKEMGIEMSNSTVQPIADPFDIISKYVDKMESLTSNLIKHNIESIGKLNQQGIKRMRDIKAGKIQPGVYAGFDSLQQAMGGWMRSELIVLGARPAMGKTALAIQFLIQPAIKFKIPTALFSLEMGTLQITARVQSIVTRFSSNNILRAQLTNDEINSVELSTSFLNDQGIYIDGTPALNIYDFRNRARKLKNDYGVQLIIIDYLQLMRAKAQSREQEISTISRTLKEVAKELDIPIIALCQLNRDVEKRASKRPMLSDLRESGAIEQDAGLVMFLHRPEYYGDSQFDDQTDATGKAEISVAKNRHGATGYEIIGFEASTTRFYDLNEATAMQPNHEF